MHEVGEQAYEESTCRLQFFTLADSTRSFPFNQLFRSESAWFSYRLVHWPASKPSWLQPSLSPKSTAHAHTNSLHGRITTVLNFKPHNSHSWSLSKLVNSNSKPKFSWDKSNSERQQVTYSRTLTFSLSPQQTPTHNNLKRQLSRFETGGSPSCIQSSIFTLPT